MSFSWLLRARIIRVKVPAMNNLERTLTAEELAGTLNTGVARVLEDVAPTEWDENHISMLIVGSIRSVLSSAGTLPSGVLEKGAHVRAEAYKVTGSLEQTHGDIVVALQYVELGLTGLGFYEAKAAAPDGSYPAFNMRQLRRLTSATPRLAVLMYDRESHPVCDDQYELPLVHEQANSKYPPWPRERVRAIGANVASRGADLHRCSRLSQSFGYHFVTRYLSGRDLDYSRTPQVALERWLKVTKRAPPIVVGITVSAHRPAEPSLMLAGYSAIPPDRQLATTLTPLLKEST
jgi:hypothetical protein